MFISPADCSRFVQKVRVSRGGLTGLPMEIIEEEVRKLAMEEVKVKAKECPICFELMVSNLHHCKQCNQAFHYRLERYRRRIIYTCDLSSI